MRLFNCNLGFRSMRLTLCTVSLCSVCAHHSHDFLHCFFLLYIHSVFYLLLCASFCHMTAFPFDRKLEIAQRTFDRWKLEICTQFAFHLDWPKHCARHEDTPHKYCENRATTIFMRPYLRPDKIAACQQFTKYGYRMYTDIGHEHGIQYTWFDFLKHHLFRWVFFPLIHSVGCCQLVA